MCKETKWIWEGKAGRKKKIKFRRRLKIESLETSRESVSERERVKEKEIGWQKLKKKTMLSKCE